MNIKHSVAIAALLACLPRSAAAEERWYGYQTLAADGAAAVLLSGGLALTVHDLHADGDSIPVLGVGLTAVGFGAYCLGGPITHFSHGHAGKGFASLGVRVAGPLVGLGLGALASDIATHSKNQVGIPIGAAAGALGAMALDASVLAWEKKPAPTYSVMPGLIVTNRTRFIGLTGRF